MFESLDNIVKRIAIKRALEGEPTHDELDQHIMDVLPPSLVNHVRGYRIDGNNVILFAADGICKQEIDIRSDELSEILNKRLGRKAISKVKAEVKKK